MIFDLARMASGDWTACGKALAEMGAGATSMEEVAGRIVTALYQECTDRDGIRACALVRFYKTHSYDNLPRALMDYVDQNIDGRSAPPDRKCLTLLGTAGDEPDWNDRRRSVGHQAIPLVSAEMVGRIPMVARLIDQFGLDTRAVLEPDPAHIEDLEQQSYRAFYVPEASGSPYIPAQETFVQPYGIRSVVGFGGILPSGDLFAIVLFSRIPISRETAEEFTALALPVKIALLPFTFRNVFAPLAK